MEHRRMEILIDRFLAFWQTYFPEQRTLTRDQALAKCEDMKRGYLGKGKDAKKRTQGELHVEQRAYQDLVSEVYGAYELEPYHLETMRRLLENIKFASNEALLNLLSLGCGPGDVELFLLRMGLIERVTLVDISPAMLTRAEAIAEECNLLERVECICAPACTYQPMDGVFDIAWSVNAAHWDPQWIHWAIALRKAVKPTGQIFFSATMNLPSTQMTEKGTKKFLISQMKIANEGDVIPQVKLPSGQIVRSMRYFWYGSPKK